jgi:hypothetical protein
MRRGQIHALRASLVLCSLVSLVPTLQAGTRTAIYVTTKACQMNSLLSADECRNAFANAEAEFNDSAPIFYKQGECEKQFPRCVVSFSEPPRSSTELRYVPKMKGVQVTVTSQLDRTVTPVLEAMHPAVRFGARTVVSSQDFRSPIKQQEAQKRWAEFQSQLIIPKLIEWCKRFCLALSDSGKPTAAGGHLSPAFLVPILDAGAQSYDPIETRQFSSATVPITRTQPRFVRRSGAFMENLAGSKEVSPYLSWNYASIASRWH